MPIDDLQNTRKDKIAKILKKKKNKNKNKTKGKHGNDRPPLLLTNPTKNLYINF